MKSAVRRCEHVIGELIAADVLVRSWEQRIVAAGKRRASAIPAATCLPQKLALALAC
jgi:hypothetical protein